MVQLVPRSNIVQTHEDKQAVVFILVVSVVVFVIIVAIAITVLAWAFVGRPHVVFNLYLRQPALFTKHHTVSNMRQNWPVK